MVLQIMNKIMDFETLFICHFFSKRFSSIALQVHTIFSEYQSDFDWNVIESLWSATNFLNKFTYLKSLTIHIPSSNTGCLFKWKIKVSNRIDWIVFLSPNSIYDTNINKECSFLDKELRHDKREIAFNCFTDACNRLTLLGLLDRSLLEYVSVTDSGKMGTLSISGTEKISQAVNSYYSSSQYDCKKLSRCYVPLLELPVSGYVMKEVTMILRETDDLPDGDDSYININDFGSEQDKEEAAYSEALKEIYKNHKGMIKRLL